MSAKAWRIRDVASGLYYYDAGWDMNNVGKVYLLKNAAERRQKTLMRQAARLPATGWEFIPRGPFVVCETLLVDVCEPEP